MSGDIGLFGEPLRLLLVLWLSDKLVWYFCSVLGKTQKQFSIALGMKGMV